VPILCLADTQLVVEAQAVAPDPSDLKQIGFIDMDAAVSACDYVGVVNKVSASSSRSFKAGDRSTSVVHGGLCADRGNSRQYLTIECNAREAATLPVSAVTAMQALNSNLGVLWAEIMRSEFELFSWSTNPHLRQCNLLKTFVLQVAKLVAYKLSLPAPYSFDGVMQYDAPALFSYNSPTAVQENICPPQ